MLNELIEAMAAQARRELREYNRTHPPRYLVIVKPVLGRRVRYYERHEWKWQNGEYVQVPQFKSKASPDLLMRERDWAERIAGEIGGIVKDVQTT